MIEPKWHTERGNVKVNDVALVQDAKLVRGEWKLGVVDEILESKYGNVVVRYKNLNTNVRVRRAVQRLIVIVPVDEEFEEQ